MMMTLRIGWCSLHPTPRLPCGLQMTFGEACQSCLACLTTRRTRPLVHCPGCSGGFSLVSRVQLVPLTSIRSLRMLGCGSPVGRRIGVSSCRSRCCSNPHILHMLRALAPRQQRCELRLVFLLIMIWATMSIPTSSTAPPLHGKGRRLWRRRCCMGGCCQASLCFCLHVAHTPYAMFR